MAHQTILASLHAGVAEIRLNRPHRLNAVTQQLYDELTAALDAAQSAGGRRLRSLDNPCVRSRAFAA